jgi:hypothetical protein
MTRIRSETGRNYKKTLAFGRAEGHTFGPLTDVATNLSPYFIITKDVKSNGKQDLAIANIDSSSVTIPLNTSR